MRMRIWNTCRGFETLLSSAVQMMEVEDGPARRVFRGNCPIPQTPGFIQIACQRVQHLLITKSPLALSSYSPELEGPLEEPFGLKLSNVLRAAAPKQ
jgi:hypothetical protein